MTGIKHLKAIVATTVLLLIIGYFTSPWVLFLIERSLNTLVFLTTPSEVFIFRLSIAFLFALCATSAGVLHVVFSQRRKVNSPMVFFIATSLALFLALSGFCIDILYIRIRVIDFLKGDAVGLGILNLFWWGFAFMFIPCLLILYLLLHLPPKIHQTAQPECFKIRTGIR